MICGVSDMEYLRLGDICSKIGSGATPTGGKDAYQGGGYKLVRSQNVLDLSFSWDGLAEINEIQATKLKNVEVYPGDVLLNITGDSVARSCIIPKSILPARVNQHVAIIRPKANILNNYYLLCYLQLNKSYLLALASTGGTRNALTKQMIEKLQIAVPPLPIQHKIASILSVYDSLIENNTKRIKLLEQMAENFYKEWFVRFRFPGHENVEMKNTKLGKLPYSFSITNMNSVIDYYIGGGWGNDEYSDDFPIQASVIRGADFPSISKYDITTCPNRFHKKNNYKSRQLQDGDIVMEISGGTSEQPVGRTVLVTQDLIDRFENGKLICASFCKLLRLKKEVISPYFFYYWMQYLYDTRIIDRFQLQSTGIINFKFEPFLKNGDVMLPPMDLMRNFDKHIIPLFQEINHLAKQNSLLARQRDLLLPRLMSGKLEVKA